LILPGKYYIQVDPSWNDSASLDDDYKEVIVDIYTKQNLKIIEVDEDEGMNYLVQGLKDVA
jgi:hypothetical protein